jgi:protein Hikeshi
MSAVVAPLFGIIIPGRPLISEFQLLDSTKAITIIEQPGMVSELTFFLLPTTSIPSGYGAILYYSLPPFQNWVLLGSVDPSKPSGIFRTGWVSNEELKTCPYIQLGVSLEP